MSEKIFLSLRCLGRLAGKDLIVTLLFSLSILS